MRRRGHSVRPEFAPLRACLPCPAAWKAGFNGHEAHQGHQEGRGLLGEARSPSQESQTPRPQAFPHWDTMGEGATHAACSARAVCISNSLQCLRSMGGFPRMQLVETTKPVSDWARWALPDQDHLFDLGVPTIQGQVLLRQPPCLAVTPWPLHTRTHHNKLDSHVAWDPRSQRGDPPWTASFMRCSSVK